MAKKSDSEIALEKNVKEIESWGILTLMQYMRDVCLEKMDNDRKRICVYQTQNYKDSPLSNIDAIRGAFVRKFNEEFEKVFKQKEKEYEERKTS